MEKKRDQTLPTPPITSARSMFRLLPMTIGFAGLLLCLKVVEIAQSGKQIRDEWLVASVEAEESAKEVSSTTEAKKPEETDKKAEKPLPNPPPTDMFESRKPPFNAREVDVLESLSARREKLDQWEKDVTIRQKILEATEQRIDQKIKDMNGLSDKLKTLLLSYNKQEDGKINSLVKVYEAMKPKDAARIFEQMDMPILLTVIDRMNERKIAPILAGMSPEEAKDVTQQLAEMRKLDKNVAEQSSALVGQ